MKIEDQGCTLSQSKKLKEIGIDPNAHLYYREDSSELVMGTLAYKLAKDKVTKFFPAFSVAELGTMLPDLIETSKQYEFVTIKEAEDVWLCLYVRGNNMLDTLCSSAAATEAQARAIMLIYLLENNIITVEDVNKRIID